MFKIGMIVTCTDNQNAEGYLEMNQVYTIREVSHRGAFVKVKGVSVSLAADRFRLFNTLPETPMELANASNQ